MLKKLLIPILIVLLLTDIGYSFVQDYSMPLDGDMAYGIVPSDEVQMILDSPLGFKALKDSTKYPNPNKYFSHWSFYTYFNTAPHFLQNFTSPINSAYLSCAIAKIIFQIGLIYLLTLFITGKVFSFKGLLSASLIVSLFQINGYQDTLGVIDPAITYDFFYALPMIFIFIYFTPLILKFVLKKNVGKLRYIKFLWIPLALVTSLSGPLNPGIALIVSLLFIVQIFISSFKKALPQSIFIEKIRASIMNIPKDYYFYLIPICIFSFYSLFLGQYNSLNIDNEFPLSVLYAKLFHGFYHVFSSFGSLILFIILGINYVIIRYKYRTTDGKRILKIIQWVLLFSLIYILLLPLGGYRDYRPNILRYDTIIPITLGLIFLFGKTTLFILYNLSNKSKKIYIPLIIIVLGIFVNKDKPNFDKNNCERTAIKQIANSNKDIVFLNNDCTVLSWNKIYNPEKSSMQTRLLRQWKIIDTDKLFYQKDIQNPLPE